MRTRSFILPGIILFSLLLIGGAVNVISGIPASIETRTIGALNNAGFQITALPEPQKKAGLIQYKDINLDEDGFSSIGTLEIRYRILPYIFKRSLDALIINGLDLTGGISTDKIISVTGWQPFAFDTSDLFKIKAQQISLKNARIAMLDQTSGGINLNFDLQMTRQNNSFKLQSALKGAQKQLSYTANAEGQINKDGTWQSAIEIEQAKFDLAYLEASRVAGVINLGGTNFSQTSVLGELQAGGLTVYQLPWQNAAITLDGAVTNPRMIIAAKSTGLEGIELGLTVPNIFEPQIMSGSVHTDTISTLKTYIQNAPDFPLEIKNFPMPENLEMVNFEFLKDKENLTFNIKNEDQLINIKGKITNTEKPKKTIEISNSSVHSTHDGSKGEVNLNALLEYEKGQIGGKITALFQNLGVNYGVLPITIQGRAAIEDLDAPANAALECKHAALKIEHQCDLTFRTDAKTVHFENLKLSGEGFDIFVPEGTPNSQIIAVENLDIKSLLKHIGGKNWKGSGKLDGTLIANKDENGNLSFEKINLQANEGGIIKITDPRFFKLLDMEELEIETMKLALENLHYDLLEIRGKGTAPDNITFTIFAKGKNPDLMQGRPFSLDMEIKPNLSPYLAKIFQY